MGSSLIQPELTFDCSLSSKNSLPKSTGEFLLEVSRLHSASEKVLKLDDFVNRLQDEMNKIDAFKRELPLCMILLEDAIGMIKKELYQCKNSIAEPVMEAFVPVKTKITDERVEEKDVTNSRDKMNWMSSVQLWNSDNNHHHHPNAENLIDYKFPISKRDNNKKRKEEVINIRPMTDDLFPSGKNWKIEKAYDPLKACTNYYPTMNVETNELSGVTELSLRTPEIKSSKEEFFTNGFSSKPSSSRSGSSSPPYGQSNVKDQITKKQRRCWSPELHRRFVSALQRLGGPQAATPKQIRELMQVDGLTNDEVKSHLQKYRLHGRKSSPLTDPSTIELGGLWVSEEHCGESLKLSNSQSGSPQAPLHLNGTCRVTSITGPDSLEEEEEDKKNES